MVRLTRLSGKKLGELLLDANLVSQQKLQEALEEQKATGEMLGETLTRLGFVSELDIARTLATQFALPYLPVSQYYISKEILTIFQAGLLFEHKCMPLDRIGPVVLLAVAGPLDPKALSDMEQASGCEIQLCVSTAGEIEQALDKYFSDGGISPAAENGTGGQKK